MNDVSNIESEEELEQKVRGIVLAHLYLKKRDRQDKVSIQELEDRLSSLDHNFPKINLLKIWNDSNYVEIIDSNNFIITDEGMTEEEKRIKERRYIE